MADREPLDDDNIISIKAARERAAHKAELPKPKKQLPVFLIFLGLLAIVVAYRYLAR